MTVIEFMTGLAILFGIAIVAASLMVGFTVLLVVMGVATDRAKAKVQRHSRKH